MPALSEEGFWKFYEDSCSTSVGIFEKDGSHAQMTFLSCPCGVILVPMFLIEGMIKKERPGIDVDGMKDAMWKLIANVARDEKASGYIHISEAWLVSVGAENVKDYSGWRDRHPGSLEHVQGRSEVLIARAVWKDTWTQRIWTINRRFDKTVFLSRHHVSMDERLKVNPEDFSRGSWVDQAIAANVD